MTTHNRVDCARINQEIIKLNFSAPLRIVHACSNNGYEKYLEDFYVPCEPLPLQEGAINLIRQSVITAVDKFNPKYLVHLEGDAWILDEHVIHKYVAQMEANDRYLICASSWSDDTLLSRIKNKPGMSAATTRLITTSLRCLGYKHGIVAKDSIGTQFFIVRVSPTVLDWLGAINPSPGSDLEETFYSSFVQKFDKQSMLKMAEREPVHPENRYACKRLSLYCQHWPARGTACDPRNPNNELYVSNEMVGKKEVLQAHPSVRKGININKLITADNFDYYNPGAIRY